MTRQYCRFAVGVACWLVAPSALAQAAPRSSDSGNEKGYGYEYGWDDDPLGMEPLPANHTVKIDATPDAPLPPQKSRLRRYVLGLGVEQAHATAGRVHPNATQGLVAGVFRQTHWMGKLLRRGDAYTLEYGALGALGAGNKGMAWQLRADASVGARAPWFLASQGPFARLGAGGVFDHAAAWSDRRISLPTLHLGYQAARRPWLFEVLATGSLILLGRYSLSGTDAQNLDVTHTAGGMMVFVWRHGMVEAAWQRAFASSRLDELTARVCGDASPVSLCTWLKGYFGDLPVGGVRTESNAWSVGLLVGYSGRSWTPPQR